MTSLRESMPVTADLIDALRGAFGVAEINQIIRNGAGGLPVFYACENGQQFGTRLERSGVEVSSADMVLIRTTQKEKQ